MIVHLFESNYGRVGRIFIERQRCKVCRETKDCLIVDNSGGEYHAGIVCEDCIEKAFKFYYENPNLEEV